MPSPITFTSANTVGGAARGQLTEHAVDLNGAVSATFDGGGNYTGGTILENVTIAYAGGTGSAGALSIENSSPYLADDAVSDSADNGIAVSGGSPRIDDPAVSGSAGTGISLSGKPSQVTGGTVDASGADGIYLTTSNAAVTGVTVSNSAGNGITMLGGVLASGGPIIEGNTVLSTTGQAGIFTGGAPAYGSNPQVLSNTVSGGSQWGIIVYDNPQPVFAEPFTRVVDQNTVSNNAAGGIWIHYMYEL